jgi:hypothetical protein
MITSVLYLLKNAEQDSKRPSDLLVDVGTAVFSTTDATVEVATPLTEVMYAILTPDNAAAYDVDDQLSTDKVVTTGAVTVARGAAGTSGLGFSYMFFGRKDSA